MGLQFKVVYKKGRDNVAADALSRVGYLVAIQAVSSAQLVWVQEVANSYATDSQAQELLARLTVHSLDAQGYSLQQGIIRFRDRIWVGQNSGLQTKIITALHSSLVGGHFGQHARIKRMFVWKGLKQHVEAFIQQCSICQQAKHSNTKLAGLLQSLPIPKGLWQDLSLDLWKAFLNLMAIRLFWWLLIV